MRKRRFALGLPFALAAALILALRRLERLGEDAEEGGGVQGRVDLRRPAQRRRVVAGPRQGTSLRQSKLGSNVETTFKENVPEGPQVAQVIEGLIRDGNKIIFATSFGFQGAMVAAAKKHPDVKFEMATGTAQSKNMAEYFGAGEDAIYLSGMAAGAATKKGVIGYVVPFAIPEVIRHANAFALGAQATHPGVKVRLIWTNSWFSPDEGDAGRSKPAHGRFGRARAERRQSGGGSVRREGGDSVGRLRLGRAQVRAQAVADRGDLQLGPVLPAEDQGRDERDRGRRTSTTATSRTRWSGWRRTDPRSRRRRRRRSRRRGLP